MSEICDRIHRLANKLPRLRFPFNDADVPNNGIYILFEQNELAHGVDRIVRIGTHTGENQLCPRLKQHFLLEKKDRSIFRKNIGRALLAKSNDDFAAHWEKDLTTRAARDRFGATIDLSKQQAIESQVSQYIRNHFTFVVLNLSELSSLTTIESKLISTVSRCEDCQPSPNWLGHHSPVSKIRESGLWLVNGLYKTPYAEEDAHEVESLFESWSKEPRTK